MSNCCWTLCFFFNPASFRRRSAKNPRDDPGNTQEQPRNDPRSFLGNSMAAYALWSKDRSPWKTLKKQKKIKKEKNLYSKKKRKNKCPMADKNKGGGGVLGRRGRRSAWRNAVRPKPSAWPLKPRASPLGQRRWIELRWIFKEWVFILSRCEN